MSRHIDKADLISKLQTLEGLTVDERSSLIGLLCEEKKYGLVWEDKPEDVEERLRDSLPVLREVKGKALLSDEPDAPNHILIEGDNLEALTALSYTHEGRIDVMYYDPPYNTGDKDFIYNDSFIDTEDSFRHSKWLSFMDKRLKLSKSLLSEEGIILISINDIELYNLKILCDSIFGERNFVANFIWQSTPGSNTGDDIKTVTEYVVAYAKNISCFRANKISIIDDDKYNLEDEYVSRRGKYTLNKLDRRMTGSHYSDALNYPILMEDGTELYPGCQLYKQEHWNWRWSKAKVEWGKDNGFVVFKKSNKRWAIYFKQYLYVDNNDNHIERALPYQNLIKDVEGMNSARGTQEIMELFNSKAFDYPKPLSLLHYLLKCVTKQHSTILDIFAGSGTTLHATMQLNAEDGGHRQCILVTNNENNICEEVTYERNKRVIEGYTTPKGQKVEGLKRNTLRYYRTELLPREMDFKARQDLMRACTDLLCIKEDIYCEQREFCGMKFRPSLLRYFCEGTGKRMLVVYDERVIEHLVPLIERMEGRLKVYVFSNGPYAYEDEFANVRERVEVCALPEAILQAYKKVLPQREEEARI